MKIDRNNTALEFACKVCLAKFKEKNPNAIDCAFRAFDNEYCPTIEKLCEEKQNEKLV